MMSGEGRNLDYKLRFDFDDPKARTNLVKDIVAMANSGGGRIVIGRDETSSPGIPPDDARRLDSAPLTDYMEKYVGKGLINLRHEIEALRNGNRLVTIHIEAAAYPVVMTRDGTWSGFSKRNKLLFQKGDIWVRHGSKTERVSQADVRRIIQDSFANGIKRVLSAAQIVLKGGPESAVEFLAGQRDVIRSPDDLLRLAQSRRALDLPYLLGGKELLWLFALRRSFSPTEDQLELMIESALRRPVTLYWWLMDSRVSPDMIRRALFRVPEAEDRDKSDAAKSSVELGAFFLDEEDMQELLGRLVGSRYAHFRRAAAAYRDKDAAKRAFIDRVERAKIDGMRLVDLPVHDLEEIADRLASKGLSDSTISISRRLADVIRCLWGKKQQWIRRQD